MNPTCKTCGKEIFRDRNWSKTYHATRVYCDRVCQRDGHYAGTRHRMDYTTGDRCTWTGRPGTVIATCALGTSAYGRLLLDDVHLAYWVEFDRLEYA